jgi:hypothetical protein
VVGCLQRLHNSTGAGFDGWTPSLLKCVSRAYDHDLAAKDENGRPAQLHLNFSAQWLVRVAQQAAQGTAERHWLLFHTITPLSKPAKGIGGSPGIRPISVGSLIQRLVCQVALVVVKPNTSLLPNQWGVDNTGGAEAVIARLTAKVRTGRASAGRAWDLANGYGNISRFAVARETWRQHPSLFSLLQWKYGAAIDTLVWKVDGSPEVIPMEEGLTQGGNLAGAIFSYTLAPRIVSLMEQCPALDVDALLDDIIGTQETAGSATLDAAEVIMTSTEWKDDGFLINLSKTREFTREGLDGGEAFKVLGAWIGDSDACAAEVQAKLDKWLPRMERARLLGKQAELLALRLCFVPKIQFWLRTMPPTPALNVQWSRFDRWVVGRVETLAEVMALSQRATDVVQLAMRGGGLGLYNQRCLHRIARGAAVLMGRRLLLGRAKDREALCQRTASEGVGEIDLAESIKTAERGCVQTVAGLLEKTAVELWAIRHTDELRGMQHTATVRWQADSWRTGFLEAGTIGAQYRLVEGSSRLARAAMQVIPSADVSTHITDREMVLMLRYKLGQGMRDYYPPSMGAHTSGCTVCSRRFFNSEHALTCARANGQQQRNHRHGRLQRLLASILRRAGTAWTSRWGPGGLWRGHCTSTLVARDPRLASWAVGGRECTRWSRRQSWTLP